jgi:two-component system, NarL family, nitrate/nitrite response regulator NarL
MPAARFESSPRARIQVVVLSDIRLYREGLAEILDKRGPVVVGTAGDRESGVALVSERRPDIVLVDMAMTHAAAAVRALLDAAPHVPVVALGVSETEDDVIACAEAGVSGYVTRDESVGDLVAALESVSRGEMICSPGIAAALLRRVTALARREDSAPRTRLTRRELEIVELIDRGLSNKEIARRLSIELATVKNHVHNILEKLQVRRRTEAAARVRGREATGTRLARRAP